jgi:hypothetical protein
MRSRILSIAGVSRAAPELSEFGVVFDGPPLGAGREGGVPATWAATLGNGGAAVLGNGGATFGVRDFNVLLAGFGPFSIIFYGVHHVK